MSQWDFIELLYLERTEEDSERGGKHYWRGASAEIYRSPP